MFRVLLISSCLIFAIFAQCGDNEVAQCISQKCETTCSGEQVCRKYCVCVCRSGFQRQSQSDLTCVYQDQCNSSPDYGGGEAIAAAAKLSSKDYEDALKHNQAKKAQENM